MTAVDSQNDAAPAAVEEPGEHRSRAAVLPASLVFVAFSVIFIARSVTHYRGHLVISLFDDAMISMRYANNLAHGHGFVWNPGQAPVEGFTNFGWALWMALVHLLGFNGTGAVVAVLVSCVALSICVLYLVRSIGEEIWPDERRPVSAAVWIAALAYPLAFWSLRGMEVGVLSALTSVMALMVLRLRNKPGDPHLTRILTACMVVAVVVRMDALVVCATAIAAAVWISPTTAIRRRTLLVTGGAVVAAMVAQTAFRLVYYGDPLPNTYYLKVAGTPLFTRLQRGIESTWELTLGALLPLVGLAAALIRSEHTAKHTARRDACLILAALVAMPMLYSIYVGGDAWEWMQITNRYQTTSLPLLCVLAGGGLTHLLSLAPRTRRLALYASVTAVLGGFLASAHGLAPTGMLQYDLMASGDVDDRFIAFLFAALVLLILAAMARERWGRAELVAGILAVTLLVSGQSLLIWGKSGGLHVRDDETMALYGLVIRDSTTPRASVAVIWAGASPYFSGRPAVDLLGKSDRKIAHEPPQPVPFYPGHTKWDYYWSIGQLRPDIVADYWHEPSDFPQLMDQWGYDKVWPKVWVKRASPNVDTRRLVAGLAEYPRISDLLNSHQ